MQAKKNLIALAVSLSAALAIHFLRILFSPRGKVISDESGELKALENLPIGQYLDAAAKYQREMSFFENISYHLQADIISFYLPIIALNALIVFLALHLFNWASIKYLGSNNSFKADSQPLRGRERP